MHQIWRRKRGRGQKERTLDLPDAGEVVVSDAGDVSPEP
jgi:hypothetical protein